VEPEETHVFPIGSMTLEGKPPVRRDTIFRLASMTKPITAVAAMMLIEEGKLKLDEPIDLLAPELADHRVLKRIDGPLDDTVPVCTENSVLIDYVTESPNVSCDDRSVLPLPGPVCLAVQVEEPT
jgi:hypothetical protein